jgi:hypothetical protein
MKNFQKEINKSFKYLTLLSRDNLNYQSNIPELQEQKRELEHKKVGNNDETISNSEFNEYIALLRQRQDSKYLEAREAKVGELVKKQLYEFIEDLSEPKNIYNVKLLTVENVKTLAYHIFAQLADQIFLKRYVDSGLLMVNSLKKKVGRPRKEKINIPKRPRGRPRKGLTQTQSDELAEFMNYHFDKHAYLFVNHFMEKHKKMKLTK